MPIIITLLQVFTPGVATANARRELARADSRRDQAAALVQRVDAIDVGAGRPAASEVTVAHAA